MLLEVPGTGKFTGHWETIAQSNVALKIAKNNVEYTKWKYPFEKIPVSFEGDVVAFTAAVVTAVVGGDVVGAVVGAGVVVPTKEKIYIKFWKSNNFRRRMNSLTCHCCCCC